MAEILDYFDGSEPRDVIHRLVEELAGGRLVGLPFDTAYATCGIATDAQVGQVLQSSDTDESIWALACPSVELALSCLPPLSPLQLRLVSRLWPGPVLMRFRDAKPRGVIEALSAAIVPLVKPRGVLQLVVPESSLCNQVLQLLPNPLVFASSGGPNTGDDATLLEKQCGSNLSLVVDAGPTLRRFPLTILDVSADSWSVARPLSADIIPTLRASGTS